MEPQSRFLPATPYIYKSLENTDIRVIAVHPLQDNSSTVDCSITQAPLESLSFTALSYVWGDPTATADIIVNDTCVKVTANLESYLRILAVKLSAKTPYDADAGYLWVDALCIDQSNIEERNAQVQRMGSIYTRANRVVVWLGNGGDHVGSGADRIRELARITTELGGIEVVNDPLRRAAASQHIKDTINGADSDERKGMMEIFQSPWWTRTWVLQELALAKNVLFLCGQQTLTFQEIFHAVVHLYFGFRDSPLDAIGSLKLSAGEEKALTSFLNLVNTRAIFEHNFRDRYTAARLQMLLQRTQRAKATDPRDKVYGLLGMLSDPGKAEIVPRYDQPVRQVYIGVVTWHLKQYDSLSILGQCYSRNSAGLESLPSWVPHWEPKEYLDEGPVPFYWEQYEDLTLKSTLVPYHASRDLPLSAHPWSVDALAGKLNLTGAFLGTITFLSQPADLSTAKAREDPFAIAKEWLKISEHLEKKYPFAPGSSNLAFRQTMVGDFHNHVVVQTNGAKYMQRGFALMLPDDPPFEIGGTKWDYKDSLFSFLNMADKRRIAISSEGWVGLVSETSMVGDEIVVFVGGPVLYIVRSQNVLDGPASTPVSPRNEYALIGEAYFHGFMDGQALEGRDLNAIALV